MILLTGATGTSGSEIAKALTRLGVRFRALVRSRESANSFAGTGVELVEGDFAKPESLDRALAGVDKALLLAAPDPRSSEYQRNFVAAAKRSGLKHLVKFSAQGADVDSPAELLRVHGAVEKMIEDAGIAFTHLQPTVFMQNFIGQKGAIHQGAIYAPIENARIAFVDVRDIAAVAAKTLTEPGHEGKKYEITGPEALTHGEIASKLSVGLGIPVQYVNISPQQFQQGLLQAGLPAATANGLNGLFQLWRRGTAAGVTNVVRDVGRKPPIGFDQFVNDYKSAFQS
jgi:uncharacterized protein YbjT (DUF2867 family)